MDSSDDNFRLLMRRIAEGSEEAAWQIVEQYGEDLRRTIRLALDSRLRSKFDSRFRTTRLDDAVPHS